MRSLAAGGLGGFLAGVLLSAVMVSGRRAGLLHETLAERAEDWLDRNFGVRRRVGERGTTLIEQGNHLASAAAFGVAYAAARPWFRGLPPVVAGTLFGTGLYAVNIAGIAPAIGLTRGERREPAGVIGQRLAMHVLFGVATAVAVSALLERTG